MPRFRIFVNQNTNTLSTVLKNMLNSRNNLAFLITTLLLFAPPFDSKHSFTLDSSAYAAELVDTSSNEFISKVKESEGIKVIVSFASWCGHCRSLIKSLYNWDSSQDKAGEQTPVHFYLLALDESPEGLRTFAKGLRGESMPIYYIENRMQISRVLYSLGINYQGAVPHITIFDKGDNIVYNDNADLGTVLRVISKNMN